jgi:protein phosphatase-4 regulatory subunit 3
MYFAMAYANSASLGQIENKEDKSNMSISTNDNNNNDSNNTIDENNRHNDENINLSDCDNYNDKNNDDCNNDKNNNDNNNNNNNEDNNKNNIPSNQLQRPNESDQQHPYDTPIPRRVKLYKLSADKWIDCGTGYCSGKIKPIPHFFVINESNTNEILLKSNIQGSTQYQRQQDTLIVWTNDDGIDYALSFQESKGCLELCEFLTMIQKDKIAPNISLVAIIQSAEGEITEIIAGPIPELPIPNNDNLGEILDILTINQFRNKIILQILDENGEWLINLLKIFNQCEENHQLSNIYCLTDIIKTLIYFNEIDIFELFIHKDLINSIIGMLEYEPEFPGLKMNWREFLNEKIKIKEIIKLENNEIKDEITKVFVLKFLKDAVLARLLDDSGFNCISTMIQNKESKILEFIQCDLNFLNDLFSLYDRKNEDNNNNNNNYNLKIDGIKLLNQLILTSKSLPPFQRSKFYKSIINKGLMKMIEFSISEKEISNRILITEIIVAIIEHDISLIKDSNDEILMNILINILINEENIGLKTQAFEAIKLLVDPSNIIELNTEFNENEFINNRNNNIDINNNNINNNNDNNTITNTSNNVNTNEMIDDSFFVEFYEKSASKLFKPLISIENRINQETKISRGELITLESLCDLLSFISKFHDKIFSRSFILENHILKSVNILINSKLKYQLRLSAIRCLRSIILLNDEFYTRYIIEKDILNGFIEVLKNSNNSSNLVNSTCLNFLSVIIENLEFSNFQLIQKYLIEKYSDHLNDNYIGVKLLKIIPQIKSEPEVESESESELDNELDNVIISGGVKRRNSGIDSHDKPERTKTNSLKINSVINTDTVKELQTEKEIKTNKASKLEQSHHVLEERHNDDDNNNNDGKKQSGRGEKRKLICLRGDFRSDQHAESSME